MIFFRQRDDYLLQECGSDDRTDVTIIIQSSDVTWIFKLARNYSSQLKFPMSSFYSSCSWKITTLWSPAIALKASHSLNMSLVTGTSCSCSGQYYTIRHSIFMTLGKEIMLLADRSFLSRETILQEITRYRNYVCKIFQVIFFNVG